MTQSQPTPQIPTVPDTDTGIAVALGRIPSGLFVITWRQTAQDHGMLASWVMQAGFDPPLVSVAVGTSRDLLAATQRGTPFVVNVLADSQRSLAGRFGKPGGTGADPFTDLPLERTANQTAVLAGAVAWLECQPMATVAGAETGDHQLILGRVVTAHGRTDGQPLVHLRRNGLRY